ncbi:transglutaminase domain-containing protein [Paenibacillus paeoniae]|uniref:Transglutaminase n=1 Tax=Paenibacillus paeoniae TaxID=2292705 RepID=A0A371PFE7_9BACL|nr:transglutaminase domain-containing protein [Paenibacillus paeoniae]REK74671.1 transglutaminase [Paenibacillus paeoniae]
MRKGAVRLLVIAIVVAVVYSLDLKLNLFPTNADSDQEPPPAARTVEAPGKLAVAEVEEPGRYEKLELELAKGFKERDERFSASYTGDKSELSDQMTTIIRAALTHDDYSAYLLESYLYTIRSWGNKSTITVEAKYRESPEETAQVDRAVEDALNAILTPGMNNHEKVKAIHDWIVTNVEYDQSLSYYTAYHAISLGQAVCQGYSLLGYRMLEKAGIPVLIAEGKVNTGEHAWNMVELDGQWYHLDLTWDDPVGAKDDRIRYTYYLKTDEELRADHEWTRTYPEAATRYADALKELAEGSDGTEADRYEKLKIAIGLHWLDEEHTVADTAELREKILSAVSSRKGKLEFRYEEGSNFPAELKAAFEGVGVSVGYRASYEKFGSGDSLLVQLHLNYP